MFSRSGLLVLLLLTAIPAQGAVQAYPYRKVKIQLHHKAPMDWVNLYVNGAYHGKVYRSAFKTLILATGRRHRFKVVRHWMGKTWQQTKQVFVRRKGVGFQYASLLPSQRVVVSRVSRLRIHLSSKSRVAYAFLFLNDKYKGRIRRGKYRDFKVRPGRLQRIFIRRIWKKHTFWRERSLRVAAGKTQHVIFLLDR